uniref:Small ribosomal subunit protein mS31 n=1 Tax=Romanomermis culicivorax TaxID=13658 RepID=A0A915K7G8_ROMCU
MRRSIFFNFRHFSTKKVGDILGKSSTASKTKSKVSELTEILANRRPPPRTLKQASENANKPKLSPEERLVGAEMAQAASKVGEILGDGEKIKSDLLKKLIEIDRETFDLSKPASQNVVQEEESTTTTNFLSTLSNMTIANEEKEKTETELFFEREKEFLTNIGLKLKVERQKNLEKRTKLQSSVECQFVDFLKGDRLNLFDDQMEIGSQAQEKPILNPIWEKCRLKHLTWLTDVQPRNGFEEMIEWTEKGDFSRRNFAF